MRVTIVHGMGCVESGAKGVFLSFISAIPQNGQRFVVICTSGLKASVVHSCKNKRAVVVVGLNHSIFGRWLRLPFELLIAIAAMTRVIGVVNFSHYGLCLGGAYSLFIHSEPLLDNFARRGWDSGRPNWLKILMLKSCLRSGSLVMVQTRHMSEKIKRFCFENEIPEAEVIVCRPKVVLKCIAPNRKIFPFQLFYPCSRFEHKRWDLAIEGVRLASRQCLEVGLVITTNGISDDRVYEIGTQTLDSAHAWLKCSDALLFTSERESLGLPLLEAIEGEIPVIAPRLSYAEELLGDSGVYFEDFTVEAVANAVVRCFREKVQWQEKVRERHRLLSSCSYTFNEQWQILLGALPKEKSKDRVKL